MIRSLKLIFLICLIQTTSFPFLSAQVTQVSHVHFDEKPFLEGEFLVQLTSETALKTLGQNFPDHYEFRIAQEVSKPMRIWLVKFNPEEISHPQMQNLLYSQKEVSIVDYNYKVTLRSTTPDDPNFSAQWHHVNTGQGGGTPGADIDSDLAWDITTGGTTAKGDEIVVCIIESVDLNHNDLDPNRWINTAEIPNDSIDNDGNGYVDDYFGWNVDKNNDSTGSGNHGTSVAGMIGARGNNSLGVSGINWNVKLMVVAGHSISSQASIISAYTYPLIMRQRWNNSGGTDGAFVVVTSSSWGIDAADPSNYPLWCAFYDTLGKYGIMNIAATTNSNLNVDVAGDMPTGCPSKYMVGVGRTDFNDNPTGGYGINTIYLGAPGVNVFTTMNTNVYGNRTGTSFACPLTAGVVALAYSIPCDTFMNIVSNNPSLGADLVRQSLLSGVDKKTQLETRFITGGRLNARKTLDELMNFSCNSSSCFPPFDLSVSTTANSATLNWDAFSGITQFNLYYRKSGEAWNLVNLSSTSHTLNGLDLCSEYEFYMESVCGTDFSNQTSPILFSTAGCENCVELNYCESGAINTADEWIESVEIGSFIYASGNDNGYGRHLHKGVIELETGEVYTLQLTPGFGSIPTDQYSRIWIDLNQNGVFEPGELLYDQGAESQGSATGSITIPETATEGSTRMRVMMAYQGVGQTTLPVVCGLYSRGETEDYCVEIISTDNTPKVGVFPNPAEDVIFFMFEKFNVGTLEIIDRIGRRVYFESITSNFHPVYLYEFSAGIYIYQVRDSKGFKIKTGKISVVK